ncbi:hypothetical protein E2C01_002294 [Portunus trituberculatus]|uniref:Uncharacterized protein n=1 Tax=Portunus trituberculatus TaxID=210409 RepID=A0A5B7CJC7_PORTR|nr:hypothetical protein [Portunus trituberculatus]
MKANRVTIEVLCAKPAVMYPATCTLCNITYTSACACVCSSGRSVGLPGQLLRRPSQPRCFRVRVEVLFPANSGLRGKLTCFRTGGRINFLLIDTEMFLKTLSCGHPMSQEDINKIYDWSKKRKLEFNAKKCHVMALGKSKRPEQIMKTKL